MSLNIIKKNTNSPFHLQRSIVPQGEEDGAYARGGYNPDALYNNDAANAAVQSFGIIAGAALAARKKNKEAEKKEPEKPKTPKNTEKAAKATKIIEDTFDPFGLNKIDPSKWKK